AGLVFFDSQSLTVSTPHCLLPASICSSSSRPMLSTTLTTCGSVWRTCVDSSFPTPGCRLRFEACWALPAGVTCVMELPAECASVDLEVDEAQSPPSGPQVPLNLFRYLLMRIPAAACATGFPDFLASTVGNHRTDHLTGTPKMTHVKP